MSELNRKGHRERVKESYLKHSFSAIPDHQVLELLLFYAIPQKDTKPLAYDLINHFGSLENVFKADIDELVQVKGVKEHTAILIDLIKNINIRMANNSAKEILVANNRFVNAAYVEARLKPFQTEKVLIISLDNSLRFINEHLLESGCVNCATFEAREVLKHLFADNAAAVLLAHNHPGGDCFPSPEDISCTSDLAILCRKMHICCVDHMIVGNNGVHSMFGESSTAKYFDRPE